MMKLVLSLQLIFLMIASTSQASFIPVTCAEEVQEILKSWEKDLQWKLIVEGLNGYSVQQSPTKSFGVWVQLANHPQGSAVIRFSPEHTEIVVFSKEKCKRTLKIEPGPLSKTKPGEKSITDADLEKWKENLSKKNQIGMVYVWSPHMNLSFIRIQEVIDLAKKLNLDLKIVLDPNANQKTLLSISKKYNIHADYLSKVRSVELERRELNTHFPSYHLINGQGWMSPARLGYESPKRLERSILEVIRK